MYNSEQIDKIGKWLGTGSINILGRPFAGKDYQGRQLVELFGGNLIGGGEILRNSILSESAKEAIRTGKLVPTDDYINTVLPYLSQTAFENKPLLLSSVGRWHGEENGVMKVLENSNHNLKAVIYLDIPNEESHVRWLAREINNDRQNRHDDTEEILQTRFNEFQAKTIPVIEFYRNNGLLIEIDGKQTRDKVTSGILNALYEKSLPK